MSVGPGGKEQASHWSSLMSAMEPPALEIPHVP